LCLKGGLGILGEEETEEASKKKAKKCRQSATDTIVEKDVEEDIEEDWFEVDPEDCHEKWFCPELFMVKMFCSDHVLQHTSG